MTGSQPKLSRMSLKYCAIALTAVTLGPVPIVAAQEMVQPLPPAGMQDLNGALARLAANSRDVGALIDAGRASLELGDIDAAIGFFGRADDLSPGNAQVKVGLAGAFVRSERPLEALRLFDEAERAGVSTAQLAVDRGLAFDLVGDNINAQTQYRTAMAQRGGDEAIRRLALSQAIAGDRTAFEATLLPLLQRQDLAGFRTRAFGLAILGQEADAMEIARTVMPAGLSAQIVPYLRYMPRLTKAQQAAAGNLGVFPRAAQIGRDDPRIAQYANSAVPAVRMADARLAPAGRPLGTPTASVATAQPQRDVVAQKPSSARDRRAARSDRSRRSDPLTRASSRRAAKVAVLPAGRQPLPTVQEPITPAPTPSVATLAGTRVAELPPQSRETLPQPAVQSIPRPATQTSVIRQLPITELPAPTAVLPVGLVTPSAELAVSSADISNARPGFNLATVQQIDTPASTVAADVVPEPISLAEAFASFAAPTPATVQPSADAVDITAIKPAREAKPEPAAALPKAAPPNPAPPKNPERIWVQVATGKNVSAFKYDWRQMARKVSSMLDGIKPHVAQWGQTNRLLAGPYLSAKAARDALAALKEAGIDGFRFDSADGQEVEELR